MTMKKTLLSLLLSVPAVAQLPTATYPPIAPYQVAELGWQNYFQYGQAYFPPPYNVTILHNAPSCTIWSDDVWPMGWPINPGQPTGYLPYTGYISFKCIGGQFVGGQPDYFAWFLVWTQPAVFFYPTPWTYSQIADFEGLLALPPSTDYTLVPMTHVEPATSTVCAGFQNPLGLGSTTTWLFAQSLVLDVDGFNFGNARMAKWF